MKTVQAVSGKKTFKRFPNCIHVYSPRARADSPQTFDSFTTLIICCKFQPLVPASVAQLDADPTGDQEVVGWTYAESATFFRGDLIMKYFLCSLSPFR